MRKDTIPLEVLSRHETFVQTVKGRLESIPASVAYDIDCTDVRAACLRPGQSSFLDRAGAAYRGADQIAAQSS
jgi:hypothetical protein